MQKITNQILHKTHVQGNDFLIIQRPLTLDLDNREAIRKLAHRQFGIGCDQLFFITITKSVCQCDIYNRDGSPASFCLNGLYALAQTLFILYPNTTTTWTLCVEQQTAQAIQINDKVLLEIPTPKTKIHPISLPNRPNTLAFHLHVGNPHILIPTDNIHTFPLREVGLSLQKTTDFADGINVSCFTIHHSAKADIRTFERGCGLTYSCGSAGLSLALIYWQKHHANTLTIQHPGGSNTYCRQKNHIQVQGEYQYIAKLYYAMDTSLEKIPALPEV